MGQIPHPSSAGRALVYIHIYQSLYPLIHDSSLVCVFAGRSYVRHAAGDASRPVQQDRQDLVPPWPTPPTPRTRHRPLTATHKGRTWSLPGGKQSVLCGGSFVSVGYCLFLCARGLNHVLGHNHIQYVRHGCHLVAYIPV